MRMCWVQTIFLFIVVTLSLGQILTACGNKKELFLPEVVEESDPDKEKKSEKDKLKGSQN